MEDLVISSAVDAVKRAIILCKRVGELTLMFKSVYERHLRLLERIEDATPDDETLQDLLREQQAALEKFNEYTTKVSKYKWLKKLYKLKKIDRKLQKHIGCVEATEEKLALAKERVNDAGRRNLTRNVTSFRISFEHRMDEQQFFQTRFLAALQKLAEKASNKNLLGEALKDPDAVGEVAMLQFQCEERWVDNPKEHVAVMKTVLTAIFATPDFQKPEFASWFLSPDVIKFDGKVEFLHGELIALQSGTYDGMKVAIKRMKINSERRAMSQFKHELNAWTKVQHENVVRLYGACDNIAPAFFVYEDTRCNFNNYFSGNDKSDMWRLFYQAALGLKHLHRKKIVHGDIRGANLLVGKDGLAKVSGFGFSYARELSEKLSNRPQASSERWKAPECLRDDDNELRRESDIYSFGVCIWEIASDSPPYGTSTDEEAKEMILNGNGFEKPDGMEDEQWEFIETLLAFEMEKRPDINDVIDQLQEFAELEDGKRDAAAPHGPDCLRCKADHKQQDLEANYA